MAKTETELGQRGENPTITLLKNYALTREERGVVEALKQMYGRGNAGIIGRGIFPLVESKISDELRGADDPILAKEIRKFGHRVEEDKAKILYPSGKKHKKPLKGW